MHPKEVEATGSNTAKYDGQQCCGGVVVKQFADRRLNAWPSNMTIDYS